MSVIVNPENGKKSFDLRTHIRDPKTGAVIKHQPYRMHCDKTRGTIFERNGVRYFANGDRVDRQPEEPKAPPAGKDGKEEKGK